MQSHKQRSAKTQAAGLEPWRRVWRDGLAPLMSDAGLTALELALAHGDASLIQGAPTIPPPDPRCNSEPVAGSCLFGFAAWQTQGLVTVADVAAASKAICQEIESRLGKEAHWPLVRWFDDTPEEMMRPALLYEVQREQARRSTVVA